MHVAVVGDGQAVHAELLDVRDQLGDAVGPVEQGVFAVGVEMDEGHNRRLTSRLCSSSARPVQRDAASLQQHQEMIEEIGRLGRETLVVLRVRRHHDLDRFLAHLLRDLRHSAVEQLGGVRPLGPLRRPWAMVRASRVSTCPPGSSPRAAAVGQPHGGEAGPGAGVAGRAGLLDPIQDRVAVAIQPDSRHALDVAGGLAFPPERLAGPAEVVGMTRWRRCARARPGRRRPP